MQRTYSIQFVSRITGINAHTIRAWEKRYKAVVPDRTEKGKRIYSEIDVDRLQKLNDLVKLGNAISDVAKLDQPELDKMFAEFVGQKHSGLNGGRPIEEIDVNQTIQALVSDLKDYKLEDVSSEILKVRASVNIRDFALNFVEPLLNEVGNLVQSNYLGIAHEHALNSILKVQIGQLIFEKDKTQTNGSRTFLLATPEGELHGVGVMIAALLCRHYKVKTYFIGENIKAISLIQAAGDVAADTLILGVSASYNKSFANRLEDFVATVDDAMSPGFEILIAAETNDMIKNNAQNVEFIPTLRMLDQKLDKLMAA